MGRNSAVIDLRLDAASLVLEVKAVEAVLGGLSNVLGSIGEAIKEAFSVKGYADYKETVKRFGKELANELLVLQLNFGKLKSAITDAVAPIASVFVPMLNQAVQAVTVFANTVGQILGALFAYDALADSAGEAAEAESELESAATSAGKAAKRSLAGFDEINRLNGPTGGSGSTSSSVQQPTTGTDGLSPQVQAIVDKIMALIEPLRLIDFTPLQEALGRLWTAFSNLAGIVGSTLEWLWFEVLVPLVTWIIEKLAPAFSETWAAAIELVCAALEPLMAGIQTLWEALQPVVDYIGESVIQTLEDWQWAFEELAGVFEEKGTVIEDIFWNVAQIVTAVWDSISPILEGMRENFSVTFRQIGDTVGSVAGFIIDALYGVTEFLAGIFTGDWERAWGGIRIILKSVVNGVISLLNLMLGRLTSALNAVIGVVNRMSFTVPDWVPGLGGASFGFNIGYVTAPQIPYLAKGAVLPANKPFLAVVGDQRHGTNVEAPLSTIQEAVALVMEDMAASNLAGQEAIIGVLRQILEAVLGIQIGDSVIAQAYDRYQAKMAVVKGGYR